MIQIYLMLQLFQKQITSSCYSEDIVMSLDKLSIQPNLRFSSQQIRQMVIRI
ncbi:hypothetical protein LINPERHAP1_LOCUS10694 [Linum perenne]